MEREKQGLRIVQVDMSNTGVCSNARRVGWGALAQGRLLEQGQHKTDHNHTADDAEDVAANDPAE